jgi:hypothetical protein
VHRETQDKPLVRLGMASPGALMDLRFVGAWKDCIWCRMSSVMEKLGNRNVALEKEL